MTVRYKMLKLCISPIFKHDLTGNKIDHSSSLKKTKNKKLQFIYGGTKWWQYSLQYIIFLLGYSTIFPKHLKRWSSTATRLIAQLLSYGLGTWVFIIEICWNESKVQSLDYSSDHFVGGPWNAWSANTFPGSNCSEWRHRVEDERREI